MYSANTMSNTTFAPISAPDFANDQRARSYLRMLALLATPLTNERGDGAPVGRPLDLWGEWSRLNEAATRSRDPVEGQAAPWAMVRLTPPTEDALENALAARNPGYQVLHISCHGTPDALIVENEQGCEYRLSLDRLVAIVRASSLRLVVLNACETATIGRALVERGGVACVVATRLPIYQAEAALLAEHLYRMLAAGKPVGAAINKARRAIAAAVAANPLIAAGTPQERAANIAVYGDPTLRLTLDAGLIPAREPWFIRQPVPYNSLFEFGKLRGFVGRAQELRALANWFAQTDRLACALTGVGGTGKTTLALNAALRNSWRFRAIVFASAKGKPDFGVFDVIEALNEALGIPFESDEAANLPGALVRRLQRYSVLLVLDNLESLSASAAADLARALRSLSHSDGSRVVMTLRSDGTGPLIELVDRCDRFKIDVLDEGAALRLAYDECQRQNAPTPPPAQLSQAQQTRLDVLRRQADLPATLQLAALAPYDRLAALAFRHPYMLKLAALLVHQNDWPGATTRLEQLHGRTIEEALDELIGSMLDALLVEAPGCMAVLHALLVFGGPVEPARLFAVMYGNVANAEQLIDFCDDLLQPVENANLIARRNNRYELDPPVVRAYIEHRRAPDAPTLRALRLRHAHEFLPVAEANGKDWLVGKLNLATLPEWADITNAITWLAAVAASDDDATRLLLDYLRHSENMLRMSYDPRYFGWLEAALPAATRSGDQWGEANVLRAIGDVQQFRDERDAALASYAAALELFRAVGSRLGEANVLAALSRLLIEREPARSTELFAQAGVLRRAIGDVYNEAADEYNYGEVLFDLDRGAEALPYFERARVLLASRGLAQQVAMCDRMIAKSKG